VSAPDLLALRRLIAVYERSTLTATEAVHLAWLRKRLAGAVGAK
jgi:hypothetical protein